MDIHDRAVVSISDRIKRAQERRRRNQLVNMEAFTLSMFEHRRPLPKQRFVAARIWAKWEKGEIA